MRKHTTLDSTMGLMSIGGLWIILYLVYIAIVIYVILLFKRLVEAVERIAARGDEHGRGM